MHTYAHTWLDAWKRSKKPFDIILECRRKVKHQDLEIRSGGKFSPNSTSKLSYKSSALFTTQSALHCCNACGMCSVTWLPPMKMWGFLSITWLYVGDVQQYRLLNCVDCHLVFHWLTKKHELPCTARIKICLSRVKRRQHYSGYQKNMTNLCGIWSVIVIRGLSSHLWL